jgi:hypothetical protein
MSVSRRLFLTDTSALGIFAALLPELAAAQSAAPEASAEEAPHDSFSFWSGFFDSVNPYSKNYGKKAASRGPTDQLPDPAAATQYLHYKAEEKKLRYATDINQDELLDHDGDVAVGIALSQYRPGSGEAGLRASQLRVDTTQVTPYLNLMSPLAWSAIASLVPSKSGDISLDDLGFKSPQATQATSRILLTGGTGKMAVNISKAAPTSSFVKALNVMIKAAKIAAPVVSLPAISVPALSSFTEALSYWENRTRFLMAGNLTTVVASKNAINDQERESHYIGLLPGDYLMLPQRHTDELAKELPNLDLIQGYLVRKDADPNVPLQTRAQNAVPGVTYCSMRISVQPVDSWIVQKNVTNTTKKTTTTSTSSSTTKSSGTSNSSSSGKVKN